MEQPRTKVFSAMKFFGLLMLLACVVTVFVMDPAEAARKKKKYHSWEEVAADMARVFDSAQTHVKADDLRDAYNEINSAYFDYYEVQGFEKNVMVVISNSRVGHIEGRFSAIKHALLGNTTESKETIISLIEDLKVKVYKDAMVLDGLVKRTDPDDSYGVKVYEVTGLKPHATFGETPEAVEVPIVPIVPMEQSLVPEQSAEEIAASRNWVSFFTAFGLLVREGLEAILVLVAIIAYLIKTGNKQMVRSVWYGTFGAVVASIALAWAIEQLLDGSGMAREMLEGWTMFLAVAVLFYVSNWMLSKSEAAAWEQYINQKVQQSIDRRSQMTLVFAAFIAVLREGAELILFYKAAFSGGMSSTTHILYGIGAGTVVLVAVYVIFRYFSVKLPLKPFFLFTSILLFLMCVSFMGKGVVELTEANVITGRTVIPAMKGFSIELLSIYDRAETLIPQAMLVIASVWVLLSHTVSSKKRLAAHAAADSSSVKKPE